MPGKADGEFTVYVKNSKPSNILLKSTAKKVTFKNGAIEETTAEDSVGVGAYKMKVSYTVAQDLELSEEEASLSFDFTVFAQFTSEDAISKKVNFSVSYVAADSSLALTNFKVSNQKEHVFTLSWTNPSGIEFKSMDYVVYLLTASTSSESSAEGEESATIKTKVESGSLEANATSLTTKTSLTAKSNYYVEITAVSANAWYTTGTDGVTVSTTDDITPPNAPNIAFSSSTEDSITLKYTKGDSTDDTATLWFSIVSVASDETETAVTDATISATVGTNTVTYSSTGGLDVSDVEANAELEIVISGLARSKTETSYKITIHAKDTLGNDSAQTSGIVVNDENNRNTEISAITSADDVAPELSSVSVSNGTSSAKISWTEPSDSDFAGVKIMKGNTEVTKVSKGTAYYAPTSLSAGETYTLYAYDRVGNEQSSGVEAKVELTSLKATAQVKYTGSILVTWDDITDYDSSGNEITYTYSVSGNGPTSVTEKSNIKSGTTGAHFTGLTVSDDETSSNLYTFTVKATASDSSTTEKSASTTPTAAKTVIWTIVNAYENSSTKSYNVIPYIPTTANSYPSDDVVSRADPNKYKFTKWIVEPGLSDSSDSDLFSLVATAADNTNAGLYMFFDFDNESRYSTKNSYDVPNWYNSGEKTHAFVTALNDDGTKLKDNGELSYATFKLGKSACTTTAYVNGTASTTGWNRIVSAYDSSYALYDYGNRESAHTSSDTSSGVEPAFTYVETLLDKACENSATSAPTVGTATVESASSVKLTWTNPTDADFSHVLITCDSESSVSVQSTDTSATITGLTGSTNYTFKITAYDYYGNASSSASFTSVTTLDGTAAPTNAKVTVGYTGQLIVTWTDATNSSDYTYTVSATSSDTTETVEPKIGIAQGTQKAVFNGLVAGNTYTFTLKSTLNGADYEYSDNALAGTAVKVLWHIKSGYYSREIVSTMSSENSGYHLVAANSGESGYSGLLYTEWLVMPSLSSPENTDYFSLMGTDSSGTESGYYLYEAIGNDGSTTNGREESSSSFMYSYWGKTTGNTRNEYFMAKENQSYISDSDLKVASFKWIDASDCTTALTTGYVGWKYLQSEYDGKYAQHASCHFFTVSSINDIPCAAMSYYQTTLTE